ncbi:hypothetical protein VTH8203_01055 [Vibrio thalassae]|uniref:Uncharacterized protein n=2 Tax=Vibrio thalassae TaxID=1243014 RepID=A0A240EG00_9VIBR|nr:hypothetical protein VTH8203_01055 [Vibrio thalassae]
MTLSDILANGVIILLILIITTIIGEKQKESIKVEQAKEITVILSREIASSLVMNSLKSSPPSILHDYNNSLLDKKIIKDRIPIFELLNNGVYEVQSKKFWSKKSLLTQDSSLDSYLSSLSKKNRMLFRIDIYDITNYYLFISILEDHKLKPKHWHFMGEDIMSEYGKNVLKIIDNKSGDNSLNNDISNEDPLSKGKNTTDEGSEKESENIIFEQELSENTGSQYIDESFISQDSLNIGDNHSYNESYESLDTSTNETSTINIVGLSVLNSETSNINFVDTLAMSYAIMLQVNIEITNGTFESLEKINPIEVSKTVKKITSTNDFKYWASDIMYLINLDNSSSLYNVDLVEKTGGYAAIGLYENRPANDIRLYNSAIAPPLNKSSDYFLEINLNTYPLPHKGNRINLDRNSVLLYVDNIKNENHRWRLIGVLDSKTRQITLGLIFSQYNNNTRELILPAEESKPSIQGEAVASNIPPIVSKSVKVAIILFIALFVVLLLFFSKILKSVYHEK